MSSTQNRLWLILDRANQGIDTPEQTMARIGRVMGDERARAYELGVHDAKEGMWGSCRDGSKS